MTDKDHSETGEGQGRAGLEELAQHIVEPILDRAEVERVWLVRPYKEGVSASVWVQIRRGDEHVAPEIDAFLRRRLDGHRPRLEGSRIEIAVMLTTAPGQLQAYLGRCSQEDVVEIRDRRSQENPSIDTHNTTPPRVQVGDTPWALTREGETLHIRIAAPIEGSEWDELLDGVLDSLEAGVRAVTLPAEVEGMTSVGQATLAALWDVLVARGVIVQRDDDTPQA